MKSFLEFLGGLRISGMLWRFFGYLESFGEFWRVLEIFREFQRVFAGFLNSVPKNLGSTKELQRVSSSFWRFLEISETFGDFGGFQKVFENFRRLLWSLVEFRGVLEIF